MQTPFAALCYFCENHGPRIVFTCQLIKNAELNIEKQSRKNLSEISSGEDNNNDMPQFYGDIYGDDSTELVDDEPRCAACSSFDPGMGMISNDHEAEISFVSTQVPINERLNQLLKQSSLRSLSVEVSAPLFTAAECRQKLSSQLSSQSQSSTSQPYENGDAERDGVVLFGDDENWYTLSYTFRLKDAKARGFHRSYSLVVVCVDKLLLLKNYDFLIKTLCRIVGKLQEMTNEFFAFEQEKNSDLRLASNIKGAHWPLHQFYPKHCDLDTSRSLKIITNDEDIFTFFHRKMAAMMKTMTSLDKDILLEGCPTQDMLIAMELNNSGTLEEKELLVSQLSPKQSILQMGNLRWIANKLIGINQTMLILFIWQLVIGEQVVVKCDHLAIRRLFLLACVHFLPIGCVQLATNSEKYFYSYKYNFLGCSLSMEIPEDAQAEIFQISLLMKNQDGIEGGKITSLECFELRLDHFPKRVEAEKPSIVTRFVQLLMDPLVNDFTLESALRATRNDWLNKAKLIFQMRHQRETTVDLNEVMRIIKCRQQDSPVILFWQKGLSKRYKQVVLNTAAKHLPSRQNSTKK